MTFTVCLIFFGKFKSKYIEFENILLNVIKDYEVKKREMFNNLNIQIGNNEITRQLKEAFNE